MFRKWSSEQLIKWTIGGMPYLDYRLGASLHRSVLENIMEIIDQKKNLVLDATILSTLMSCPRLADFRFNMNLVGVRGKSVSLEMGLICHKIIEVFYKESINGASRTKAIYTGFESGRALAMNPDEISNSNEDDKELVFKTMEEYFDYYKGDFWVPLEVEVAKGEVLYEDDEVRILWVAKLDSVIDTNAGIFPVDHKTMKQRRDSLSLNNQFIGQCIIMKTRQIIINKIGFQKTLKPHERFTRPIISYSADHLMEWQSEILPYYAKLMLMYSESGYWPPNYTHCENKYGFCNFVDVCKANPNLRELELKNNFVVSEPWNPLVTNEVKE
jgi:hypothetical protein